MDLKVLAVGDVVGNPGLERIRRNLRQLKRKTGADFVVGGYCDSRHQGGVQQGLY